MKEWSGKIMCCKTTYEWYKEHNICVRCGQEDAVRNHVLCFRCMIDARERALKYANKHKEELKEKNKIKSKKRYAKLKELGLCTSCGKRPTKHNKVYCEYCGARVRERQRKAYLLNIYATKSMAEIRV